jgi:hypothetical protein
MIDIVANIVANIAANVKCVKCIFGWLSFTGLDLFAPSPNL